MARAQQSAAMTRSSDPTVEILDRFDRRTRRDLRATVTAELLSEHRTRPHGPHSDALARLLYYFRRAAIPGKLILYYADPGWHIARLGDDAAKPPEIYEEPSFTTLDDAEHALFLMRVEELLSSDE